MRSTGSASWRTRAALLLAGTLLGVLAGEAVARLVGFRFRPHMRNRVYFAQPDPLLGWRNRPGLAGPYGGDEFLTWVTINEAGQRGPWHPVQRVPGKRRIAVLGDSQTWGDGVGDDETFVALLDGGDTEVLSFSCPGWGTDQELLALDNDAARYAPDVVLLAFFAGNDLLDNLSRGTFQYPKPYFTLESSGALLLRGVPVPYSEAMHALIEVYRAAMRYSAFLNAIAETSRKDWSFAGPREAQAAPVAPVDVPHSHYTADYTAKDVVRFALTARLLREAARHARAIGARPVVLLLPELWQVEVYNDRAWRGRLRAIGAEFRRPQRILRDALEADGVEVIDALPALARASRGGWESGRHTYYREWRHLNARGHAVLADLLAARLGIERDARDESGESGEGAPEARQTSSSESSVGRRGRRAA